MRTRNPLLVAIAAALLLFGTAACGGGDDDDPSNGGDTGPMADVQPDGDQSPDVGTDTSTEPDVAPDVETPDDVGTDIDETTSDTGPDTGNQDTGPDPCEIDSDRDGLSNCEEAGLCGGSGSDPYDGDTDGDGLSDYEEVQEGTNACKEDTDGDGASDFEELKWGLNPTARVTYSDGKLDGNRWILEACQGATPGQVDFHTNSAGNWSLALPTAFANYTNLSINAAQAPLASAVYDDPTNEVAGFMLSESNPTNATSPQEPLGTQPAGQVYSALQSFTTVEQDLTQGEFDTHDGYRASTAEYEVAVSGSEISVRKFRDQLLLAIAPFSQSEVSGLPNSSGATYTDFKVTITIIFRANVSGDDQRIVTAAIAPLTKLENSSSNFIKFRLDDLTNTTNIAEEVDSHLSKCSRFTADAERPKAEFYWVLDQSGSMNDDNQKIIDFSNSFITQIQNTALDYRLGVTNMDPQNARNNTPMRVPPGWHTDSNTFAGEIQDFVVDCNTTLPCSGGTEHGLEAAWRGIRYMTGGGSQAPPPPVEIRPNAKIITIFMSDERAHSLDGGSGPGGISDVNDYINFFRGRTTAFSIVGDGQSCGTQNGQAYKDVALATGGKTASLCANDLSQTIKDIIFAATGVASNYNPKPRPISSSLKVFMNGTWVPRSETNGYNYFANENAVAFFGDFRPDPDKAKNPNVAPDRLSIVYETWRDKCKETGQGAFNCSDN